MEDILRKAAGSMGEDIVGNEKQNERHGRGALGTLGESKRAKA